VRAGRLSCVTGATSTPDTSTVCGRSPISLHRSVHSTPSMKDHQVPPSRSSLPRVVSRCHLSRGLLDNGRHKYKHNSARFTYTCTHHVWGLQQLCTIEPGSVQCTPSKRISTSAVLPKYQTSPNTYFRPVCQIRRKLAEELRTIFQVVLHCTNQKLISTFGLVDH